MTTINRKALVLGANGLVGSHCISLLLEDDNYSQIIAATRKPLLVNNNKLTTLVIDFNDMESELATLEVDDVFCCLGTTMKKAGSKQAFNYADFELPVRAAKWAKQNNVAQYLIVTAMAANPNSLFFYNRVKGNVQTSLQQINLPALHILQPALLLGKREEKRPLERIGKNIATPLSFLLLGPLKKYRPIKGESVANAMIYIGKQNQRGTYVYPSHEIQKISDRAKSEKRLKSV